MSVPTILVALDDSPCARAAFAHALHAAGAGDANVRVVHVVDEQDLVGLIDVVPFSRQELREDLLADARTRIDDLVREVVAEADRPDDLRVDVEVGVPLEVVLERARELAAGLLVLGVHGRREQRAGAGTFATACVRRAPCSALLVGERHHGVFSRVVACVDFSPSSRDVVDEASRLAAREGSELHLLHVYHDPFTAFGYLRRTMGTDKARHAHERYRAALCEHLARLAAELRSRWPTLTVHEDLVADPNPGRGITAHARAVGADLVVLGTHGRTRLSYVLLGSTAERTLRETGCSVLVVRSPPAAATATGSEPS